MTEADYRVRCIECGEVVTSSAAEVIKTSRRSGGRAWRCAPDCRPTASSSASCWRCQNADEGPAAAVCDGHAAEFYFHFFGAHELCTHAEPTR